MSDNPSLMYDGLTAYLTIFTLSNYNDLENYFNST